MNTNANTSEHFANGIPDSSLGMIIQRGGEELILEKISNRFTVRKNSNISVKQLAQNFLGSWRGAIPTSGLELFKVAPSS